MLRQQQKQHSPLSTRKYYITHPAYQNFINSIKSQATQDCYSKMLNRYLVENTIDLQTLVNLPVKDSEQLLINYIEKLKALNKSHSYINSVFCADLWSPGSLLVFKYVR